MFGMRRAAAAQSLNAATIGFAGGYVSAPGVSVGFSAGDVVTGTLSAEESVWFRGSRTVLTSPHFAG